MTPTFDLDRLGGRRALDALLDEVLAAGEDALSSFRGGAASRAQTKPDRSPVTEADQAVERRLRAFFGKRFPDAGFLGEESGAGGDGSQALRFVVDPIDGTRAFLRGLPTWSILVGLEADGEPVLGIAYFPASGDLYWGAQGHGAYGNGRPLRVSSVASLDAALVCHGALQQFSAAGCMDLLPRLTDGTYTQRGFSDFDGYRHLLEGRADAMVDPAIMPWDMIAAAVLVREAGGTFTSMSGEPTIHGGSGLATNGLLHEPLVTLLRG
jgi:histidinol-phosphatase